MDIRKRQLSVNACPYKVSLSLEFDQFRCSKTIDGIDNRHPVLLSETIGSGISFSKGYTHFSIHFLSSTNKTGTVFLLLPETSNYFQAQLAADKVIVPAQYNARLPKNQKSKRLYQKVGKPPTNHQAHN